MGAAGTIHGAVKRVAAVGKGVVGPHTLKVEPPRGSALHSGHTHMSWERALGETPAQPRSRQHHSQQPEVSTRVPQRRLVKMQCLHARGYSSSLKGGNPATCHHTVDP